MFQATGRRNPHLPRPLKINTSLPASRKMCRVPLEKRVNHTRPVAGPQRLLHPGSLTPSAARNCLAGSNAPLQAKEQPDKCDTEDHSASSKHKDRSHSDKSSRCSSDKESSSTACKCGLFPVPHASSVEHPWKGLHVDESSHAPGEGSHTSHRSPSGSLSELKDHGSFTVPTSSSTANKLGTQPCHCSSSTDSQSSMMPLDMGLYSSFSYYGPPGFGRGGNTPVPNVAGSQHVSSSMWQPLD